jgi:DUF2934 family protein
MQESSRREPTQDESQRAIDSDTPSQPSTDSPRADPDLIAQSAYRRYETRGREDGHDVEDWLEAEREFSGRASEVATRPDDKDAG